MCFTLMYNLLEKSSSSSVDPLCTTLRYKEVMLLQFYLILKAQRMKT